MTPIDTYYHLSLIFIGTRIADYLLKTIVRREGKRAGQENAEQIVWLPSNLPTELVPINLELARMAAIKIHKKMSYADCFATALAKLKKARLVTCDREFSEVEKEIKISRIS